MLIPEGPHLRGVGDEVGGAGNSAHADPLGCLAGGDLVAHYLDGLGIGADERYASGGDGPGKIGVLGEESVAGVDAVGPGALDHVEDGLGVEIALGRGLTAQRVGLVGHSHMEGIAVEFGIHRHSGDAQFPAGSNNPNGDLPPVCDQHFGQHGNMVADGLLTTRIMSGVAAIKRSSSRTADRPLSTRKIAVRQIGVRRVDMNEVAGYQVEWVSETGSTNADLLAAAHRGSEPNRVLVADYQSAGRGRRGRTWEAAPESSLLFSVLTRPDIPVAAAHLVTTALAVGGAGGLRLAGRGAARLEVAQRFGGG